MMNLKKVTLAMVALGGTMMMAAPAALADGLNISAAGSYQTQDGTNAWGSQLDQSSSLSAGQLSADCYTNTNVSYGGNATSTTYNADGTPVSWDSSSSNGGYTTTRAEGFDTQGASAVTSQSQVIGTDFFGDYRAQGGEQSTIAGALSGTMNMDGISGGVSIGTQDQYGDQSSNTDGYAANGAQLGQTAKYGTGTTSADSYSQYTVNKDSSDTTATWNADGVQTSGSTVWNAGGTSSTSAYDYNNATANAAQDSNQTISTNDYAYGGYQDQGAIAATGFWNGI